MIKLLTTRKKEVSWIFFANFSNLSNICYKKYDFFQFPHREIDSFLYAI